MKTENVLYTDGHDVTVTDSVLRVKRKWYDLDGISKHGFSIIQPVRLRGILLLIAGGLFTAAGAGNFVTRIVPGVSAVTMNANELSLGLGLLLLLVGTATMISMSERYAVSITTAEGEKHVVVSKRRDYITQIVHALNEAFFARIHGNSERSTTQRFTVSGR